METTPTQLVRDHVRNTYVEPALRARKPGFQVVAGDVHRALRFHNRVPLVCQALKSRKFLAENNLTLERTEGPPSGLGTTATFFYRVAGKAGARESDRAEAGFLRFRGIAKDVFQSLGGGEKFIRSERNKFPRHRP
jgi:hypothetical protein